MVCPNKADQPPWWWCFPPGETNLEHADLTHGYAPHRLVLLQLDEALDGHHSIGPAGNLRRTMGWSAEGAQVNLAAGIDGCRRNDNNNDAPRSMAGGGSRRRTRRSTALPALATARGALPAAAGTRAAAAPRRRLAMFGCCCWRAESRGLPCSPPWWPWPCRPCHSCQSR